jgi:hypothetical protein
VLAEESIRKAIEDWEEKKQDVQLYPENGM